MKRVGGHVSTAGGLINAIKNTQNIGGNCLQIFAGSPRSWARKLYSIEEVNQFVTASAGLEPIFIHALYLINLATDNEELLKKSVDSLIYDLKNGQSIESAGVIVHLGSHQGRGFSSVVDQVTGVINQILSATEVEPSSPPVISSKASGGVSFAPPVIPSEAERSRGISFIIENSAGQKGKIGSLPEIEELFNKVNSPRLRLCLDSAHLFEGGVDLRDLSAIDSLVNELTERNLLKHLTCLHLNDSKTDFNSKNDQHENLGDGKIGLAGLSQFVNHPDFAHLPIILEVPGESGFPDAAQISIAKSLIP